MAAPTIYRSSDASAPVLTGQAGALLTVLDAILVNGYGTQPAAGWSKPLANSGNKGCYQNATGLNGGLWVDDSGPGAGGAREARLRGFESITAVATPTAVGLYPANPNIDVANGNTTTALTVLRKSASLDSVARQWICLADNNTFMFFAKTGDYSNVYVGHFYFGDIYSFQAGDQYKGLIVGRITESTVNPVGTAVTGGLEGGNAQDWYNNNVNYQAHYFGRNGFAATGPFCAYRFGIGYTLPYSPAFVQAPINAYDSKVYINRYLLADSTAQGSAGFRGYMRGVYQVPFAVPDGDTFDGSGDFAGRSFFALGPLTPTATSRGVTLALETTAWDTST